MDYTVLHIAVSDDEQAEILTAELADFPFESFETEDGLLKAYIPAVRLSGCKTDVDALLARRGVEGRYAVIPTQNWNASWESDFPPVDVEGLEEVYNANGLSLKDLFHIFCNRFCKFTISIKSLIFPSRMPHPGTHMHFIDG